jgi:hypothetical protein
MSTLFEIDDLVRTAVIDRTGAYRYRLGRLWGADPDAVVNFVMLNPSVADALVDDPTIRRCMGFARSWGYGGIVVTNLFAFRATSPVDMIAALDPYGPENDGYLFGTASDSPLVVCAWGVHGGLYGRGREVVRGLRARNITPHHLGLTKGGHPKHPLYLPAKATPIPWGGQPSGDGDPGDPGEGESDA